MTFVVRWSNQAEGFLSKLPAEVARRIVHKVDKVKDNPFHFLEHHEGADFLKLRFGSYRLLLDVDLTVGVVFVRALGHRRNIYKGHD